MVVPSGSSCRAWIALGGKCRIGLRRTALLRFGDDCGVRPATGPAAAGRARARLEKNRRNTAPQTASAAPRPALHQDLLSRPWGPLFQNPLSLSGSHRQLAEAVHRSVQPQEYVDHACKSISTGTGKLLLVQFQLHPGAARKGNSVRRPETREMRFAAQAQDAIDLFFRGQGAGEIVQPQDLRETHPLLPTPGRDSSGRAWRSAATAAPAAKAAAARRWAW